ncbi:IPT/TIG domain-containing protein [Streptomyces winkii]|uniref:IPT/TIG domain-containing protein n=1 Tax=Streptomyces winkii TaxID=3051178 RepID=UPI0028D695C0|nr:IPT/TIG domain-containing protein [Streptomyces sp. DSM 40971]
MAPVISALSPVQGPAAGGNQVVVSGTGLLGATAVRFGGTAAGYTVSSSSSIRATAPPGVGAVPVTVTTPGGTSNGRTYTYVPAPVVSALSPVQGPVGGGNQVVVSGTGLFGATVVRFGISAASFTVTDDGHITATAPPGTGAVPVTVTTPGGTSNGLTYSYVPAPVVSALSPVQGPVAGGNQVVVSGTGLLGATTVRFGATAAPFTVTDDGHVTAVAPAGAGAVPVTVTTPGGTSNGLTYTYLAAPVITGLNPGQGPPSGGNQVVVSGTGLAGATAVHFGAVSADFADVSDTQLTATAPPGQGAVPVSVVTAAGTSNSVTYAYTTAAAPTLADLNPHYGPTGGGNAVVITGTDLAGTTAVHFGAEAATGIDVQGDAQITVTAPAGTATVQVTVTTPAGTSDPATGNPYYTYLNQPAITALTPDSGQASGGTSVTIAGTDLTYTDEVLFGAVSAGYAALSDDLVVATAPPGTGTVPVTLHTPGGTSNALDYTYEE